MTPLSHTHGRNDRNSRAFRWVCSRDCIFEGPFKHLNGSLFHPSVSYTSARENPFSLMYLNLEKVILSSGALPGGGRIGGGERLWMKSWSLTVPLKNVDVVIGWIVSLYFKISVNPYQWQIKAILFENDIFQWVTLAFSEKEIRSSPNRSRTYDLPITSSDALPLSYRRLVGAKAIKLTLFSIPMKQKSRPLGSNVFHLFSYLVVWFRQAPSHLSHKSHIVSSLFQLG